MSHRKNNPCQTCSGTFYDGSHDDNDSPIWVCRNCNSESPRIVRKSAKRKEIESLLAEYLEASNE